MMQRTVAAIVVLAFLIAGLVAVPTSTHAAGRLQVAAPAAGVAVAHTAAPAPTPTVAAPLSTYQRTVLIETFTAQWCQYCEMESQALYYIEHHTNANVMQIAELHICYSPSLCGDNYPTSDGTDNARANFYGVSAFPTVYFDGGHSIVGAASTLSQMESWYESKITNASLIPGNVSIQQTATVSAPGVVSSHATVTSTVNGTFHAQTYFIEYIGINDSTGHDLGWVVRGSLVNQQVTLTAGTSTMLSGSLPIGPTWNIQHLAIVTYIQDNASKVVENANMVPVSTLSVGLSPAETTVNGGATTPVTVQVTNSSTGVPLAGASLALSVDGGATLSPASGVTATDGTFTTNFSAPRVSAVQVFTLSAQATLAGYTSGAAATATVTVNPLYPPGLPTNLSIVPQMQSILVSWSAPASGGGGVTYHVYRADAPTAAYTEVAVTTDTSFTDVGVAYDQSYWYMIAAEDVGGFSSNTTAVSAIPVQITPQGISPYTSWWFSVDALVMNSTTSASLSFHLAEGTYTYTYGSYSNAYLTPASQTSLVVGAALVQQTISFLPNYATISGTVTPVTATVTVNGSAVQVVNGAFSEPIVAGTYTVRVTASGYEPNSTSVTLTPGNTSTVTVALQPASSSSSTVAGLSSTSLGEIAAAVVIGLAAVLGTVVVLQRRRGPRNGRSTSAHDSNGSGSHEP